MKQMSKQVEVMRKRFHAEASKLARKQSVSGVVPACTVLTDLAARKRERHIKCVV